MKSKHNPADHASRGIHPSNKEKVNSWLHGPCYLWEPRECWPTFECAFEAIIEDPEVVQEVAVRAVSVEENALLEVAERVSSWGKLRRVVAWVLRFLKNCKESGGVSRERKKVGS